MFGGANISSKLLVCFVSGFENCVRLFLFLCLCNKKQQLENCFAMKQTLLSSLVFLEEFPIFRGDREGSTCFRLFPDNCATVGKDLGPTTDGKERPESNNSR